MTSEAMLGKHETIAIGGNILPVNGCQVDHGSLQQISLSSNRYARLQTIEYLRSFVAGRLGTYKLPADYFRRLWSFPSKTGHGDRRVSDGERDPPARHRR